jgi:DNA-binding response OmpR family regulator
MAAQEAVVAKDRNGNPARTVPIILSVCRTDAIRAANSRIFSHLGLAIRESQLGPDAVLSEPPPDLILLEAGADPHDIEICRKLRVEHQYAGSIGVWVPADFSSNQLAEWTASGADVFLPEPSDDAVLVAILQCALRARAAENEAALLKDRLVRVQDALHAAQQEFHSSRCTSPTISRNPCEP